jgi:hypothetical protein
MTDTHFASNYVSKTLITCRRRYRRMLRPVIVLLTVCAGMLWLLFGAPVTSEAQGATVTISDVKAVQVIEDVPMVPGKATVLRLFVKSSARTTVTFEGRIGSSTGTRQAALVPGDNTVYVNVGAAPGPGTAEIAGRVLPSGSPTVRQVQVVALKRDHLRVLFMPVDWSQQDRARSFNSLYNNFVNSSSEFFRAAYPLAESNLILNSTPNVFMLTAEQRAIAGPGGNFNWGAITDMYSSIALAGRRIMPDADLVIGVLPPKWFARNLNDPTVVGLELHAVRAVVADQVDSDYATAAHETGHVFGRRDDYDFNQRPPIIGQRLDSPGYWVLKSRPIDPGARPTYYSFMGAQDAGSQYWVDRDTYLSIMQALQDGTGIGP